MPDTPTLGREPRQLIAPVSHTAGLLVILLGIVLFGVWSQTRSSPGTSIAPRHEAIVPLYSSLIFLEWALFYYIWVGLKKKSVPLRDLIGGRWPNVQAVLRDIAVMIPFWVVWEATAKFTHLLLGPSQSKTIDVLLPRGILEVSLWVVVSVSAGVSEEVVYRGYLQRQIFALSGSAAVAVLGQAAVFGLSHAYQGWKQVMVITVLGLLYGLLALWRKSLRPGIMAHAWSDIFEGWLKRLVF